MSNDNKEDVDYIFHALLDYTVRDLRGKDYEDLSHRFQAGLCRYFGMIGYTGGTMPSSIADAYVKLHDKVPHLLNLWFPRGDLGSRIEVLIEAYKIERKKKRKRKRLRKEKKAIKKALFYYKLGRYTFFSRYLFGTWLGFCNYFNYSIPQALKTVKDQQNIGRSDGWWFRSGKHKPRIELLEKTLNNINIQLERL